MQRTLGIIALAVAGIVANAQGQPAQHETDNTAVNKTDRRAGEPTADQQKDNATDRDMAKNVRRALVKDKTLSTYAHNVKVISEHGTVTLKGPVRSEEEKRQVEAKAEEVAGSRNVRSELTVAEKGHADHSDR